MRSTVLNCFKILRRWQIFNLSSDGSKGLALAIQAGELPTGLDCGR